MQKKRITHKATLISMIIVLTILSLTYIAIASSNEPGSTDDPIVTKSYVDNLISGLTGQGGSTFEVVNVSTGKKLIASGGTELILRAGQATVIDSPSGGISNVTVGKDLIKEESITANHLLIVPRSDGRGATAKTDCIFMVKGSYSIE